VTTSNPSVDDVHTRSSFQEVVARVLDLQGSWSSQNTPEMQERGILIRQAGPRLVKNMLAGLSSLIPDLAVEGRDGTGRKTRVPWIRVYSKSRSPSATSGWYVAALFAADGSAVFLSINQGTTSFEAGSLKASATDLLEARVRWAQGILGATIDKAGASVDEIDLKDPVGLGAGYERANVCSYRFTRDELSDDLFRDPYEAWSVCSRSSMPPKTIRRGEWPSSNNPASSSLCTLYPRHSRIPRRSSRQCVEDMAQRWWSPAGQPRRRLDNF
jgi:hypothetical protein